jgi:hypothetical protein
MPLRGEVGPSGLLVDFWLQYRLGDEPTATGPHSRRVFAVAYEYRLLDRHERELLVYHRQPGPAFPGPDHPHLHVSAALAARVTATAVREIALDKLHLVTECVTLAAFVRMLIDEFGVRSVRADWRPRLARADAALRRWPADADA